mgnify:FL=1
MSVLQFRNIARFKKFVEIPEMERQSQVQRLDNDIEMCDVKGDIRQRLDD